MVDTEARKQSIFFDTSSMPFLKKLIWEIGNNNEQIIMCFVYFHSHTFISNNNHLVTSGAATISYFHDQLICPVEFVIFVWKITLTINLFYKKAAD